MPSSHDIIVRYVNLLPEGVAAGDWKAAHAAIDALTEEQAANLSQADGCDTPGDMDEGWTEEEYSGTVPAPTLGEAWRRYLHIELDRLIGSFWMNYRVNWKGRTGFVVEGYGFDEEPSETVGYRRLFDAGVIAAAGYELLP